MQVSKLFNEFIRLNKAGDVSPELRARLFNTIFWALGALTIIGTLLIGGLADSRPELRVGQLAGPTLLLAVWILNKRGYHEAASTIMVFGFWFLATAVVASEAGRASHWLVPQFLLIVVTRFILNGRIAILLGFITAFVDFLIYHFRINSLLPPQYTELGLGNDWVPIVLSFMFLVFIFYLMDTVLRESLNRARETEGRYSSLFNNTNDAVFLIDLNFRYLQVNQQAADLLGYTPQEVVGKTVFEMVAPEEIAAVKANFDKLSSGSEVPLFERVMVRKDGSRRIAEVSISLVRDAEGNHLFHQSVMRDVTERKRLEDQLRYSLDEMETLAMEDSLTGLLNRRAITEHAEAEWHRAERDKRPLCLILLDLDNLKQVNDHLGHLVGDQVIVELAKVIKKSKRRYDWAGRWGGDEFMLVLPGANLVDAQEVSERLRSSYAQSELIAGMPEDRRAYVSLGISCFSGRPGDKTTLHELMAQADEALYTAKQSGKNRVEVYLDPESK
jgi:diguanylate cyclase (GGDEF)-like protein/PAS domain S-box-containing protein